MSKTDTNFDKSCAYPATKTASKSKGKLIITSIVTAAVACAVCLVPTALFVVAGGGVLAVLSSWVGYAAAGGLALVVMVGFWQWSSRKQSAQCGCSSDT